MSEELGVWLDPDTFLSKDEILSMFGGAEEINRQATLARLSSNGEIEYNGWWFWYHQLESMYELVRDEDE